MAATGYCPSYSSLCFKGDSDDFEIWEEKMKSFLRSQKLYSVITLARDHADFSRDMNSKVYDLLIPLLNDESIRLVKNDASDDGKKAFEILRNHYRGSGRARILSLFSELCTIRKGNEESVTEYMLRAEGAAS